MPTDLPTPLRKHTHMHEEGELGPSMLALTYRQRAFVVELLANGGAQVDAYIAAGYSSPNKNQARANASRLANSDAIQAAILEEGHKFAGARIGVWLAQVEQIALNPTESGAARLKALDMLLSRGGSIQKTEHVVTRRTELTEAQLLSKVTASAQKLGLDPRETLRKYGVTIDAEFEEVIDATVTAIENEPVAEELVGVDPEEGVDDWMTWKANDARSAKL